MAKKLYLYFLNEDEQPTTILVQEPNQTKHWIQRQFAALWKR